MVERALRVALRVRSTLGAVDVRGGERHRSLELQRVDAGEADLHRAGEARARRGAGVEGAGKEGGVQMELRHR